MKKFYKQICLNIELKNFFLLSYGYWSLNVCFKGHTLSAQYVLPVVHDIIKTPWKINLNSSIFSISILNDKEAFYKNCDGA